MTWSRRHTRSSCSGWAARTSRPWRAPATTSPQLCKGWRVDQVRQIVAETLHELINPYVYAEAAALIEEHRAAGRDVVLVSTSGEEMVRPIGEQLGVTDVIATRMVVDDGRYTGEVEFYAAGPTKVEAVARAGRRARLRPGRLVRVLRLVSATGRCWRASATRPWSTRTGGCAGSPRRTAGRCWSSGTRFRWAAGCANGPRFRSPRPRSGSVSGVAIGIAWYGRSPPRPRRLTARPSRRGPARPARHVAARESGRAPAASEPRRRSR